MCTHLKLWFFLLQCNLFKLLKYNSFDIKVDELDKAIFIASKDPSLYGIDEVEVKNQRKWTSDTRTQVSITCRT